MTGPARLSPAWPCSSTTYSAPPALALTPVWGDVEPRFLVAGTAVNLLTVLSLTALGVFCSALTRSTAAAATLAYLLMAGFVALLAAHPAGHLVNPVGLYGEWF